MALTLTGSTQDTVTGIDVVGRLPRQILYFCKFLLIMVESGEFLAVARESSYRRSTFPQVGLEIPIAQNLKMRHAPGNVYKKFLFTYHLETDGSPPHTTM